MAEGLGRQRGIEQAQADAAVLWRNEQSVPAHSPDGLVQRRARPLASDDDGLQPALREFPFEQARQAVLHLLLLFVEREVHGVRADAVRGRPSPRSPMMLRWICAVPPPIMKPRSCMSQ